MGFDAGAVAKLGCGPGRQRTPDHPIAGGLPGVAGGVETERLAGPRRGDDDLDTGAREAQLADQVGLLVGHRWSRRDRRGDVGRIDDGTGLVEAVDGVGEETAFGIEQLLGSEGRLGVR